MRFDPIARHRSSPEIAAETRVKVDRDGKYSIYTYPDDLPCRDSSIANIYAHIQRQFTKLNIGITKKCVEKMLENGGFPDFAKRTMGVLPVYSVKDIERINTIASATFAIQLAQLH
ncbi:MAG: hypothetical protein MRY21_06255 [Simkaniaceae bacterium]|nr:hypothetical protein [Simkaniaceae bacterium]